MSSGPFDIALRGGGAIRIGFRTPGLKRELDAAGRVALAREFGMAVIEPQLLPGIDRDLTGPEDARELKRHADTAGVEIPSIGCDLRLSQGSDAEFAERLDNLLATVEVLEARQAIAAVAEPPAGVPQAETWMRVARRVRVVCDRLSERGMRFAIEPDHHRNFIDNAERLQRLLDFVGHPACLANFDACNLYLGGSDPVAAVGLFGRRMISGHIKDGVHRSDQRGEVPVGQGEVPWLQILGALVAANVACTMFLEHQDPVSKLRASAEHMRGVVAALKESIAATGMVAA
jgi:sugar phosphate isomerase/epimerase